MNKLSLKRWIILCAVFIGTTTVLPAISATRAAKIEELCRLYRLDCDELKLAVNSIELQGRLPDKWITKSAARNLGWHPGAKLGKVATGKSIGGDRFGNREKKLPGARGRIYFEADLGYRGGKRNAQRLIFSSDRLIFVTVDHYRTFEEIPK